MQRPLNLPAARHLALIRKLDALAFQHRALAHLMLGSIAKVPDLTVKIRLAQDAFTDMTVCGRLDRHAWALARGSSISRTVSERLVRTLRDVDAMPVEHSLSVAYGVVRPFLLMQYQDLASLMHAFVDATVVDLVPNASRALESQIAWGTSLHRHVTPALRAGVLHELSQASEPTDVAETRIDRALWMPLDRASNAQRPAKLPKAVPGAMRRAPLDGWRSKEGIGLAMHNQIHGEYTTMELCGRNSYEHPFMPYEFHMDMARQAADEARHALIFEDLASQYEVRYGDYPISTLTYDFYYQFPGSCDAGSRRELLWRLSLRGTVDEGLALDDLAYHIDARDYLGQHHISEALRHVLVDETFHVQAALRWTRFLCAEDAEVARGERELAARDLAERLRTRRKQFEVDHPESVEQERRYLQTQAMSFDAGASVPFVRRPNFGHRAEAGYSKDDLQQLQELGYIDATS